MKKSWILLSVALVSIFLGAVTLLTVTRLRQQQPIAPTAPQDQQAAESVCQVSFDLFPVNTSPSPNLCTGITISCSGQCTASAGVDYTCNWTKPAGATEFTMAYKDTASSSASWRYENSSASASANRWLNDKTRWIKSFTTNVSRDFMLRVHTSSSCVPSDGAYGNKVTVATCTPIGGPQPSPSPSPSPTPSPTPSPSATPVPQCNQSCTTNSQCPANLLCYIPAGQTNGNCRLPVCQTDTDCSCNPSPSPTVSPAPSVIPGVPKAGTSWPTIFLIVGGLALLVLGFALP